MTDPPENREDSRASPADAAAAAKEASRELARQLATPEGARAMRALQRAGKLRLPEPALRLPPEPSEPGTGAGDESRQDGSPQTAPAGGAASARGSGSAGRLPRPISIWQPRGAGPELAFVRPEPLPLGDHFAA